MNYCALDDAFQEIGGAPSPGCATDYSTRAARKEERKKAKRCKGPAGEYLNQNQDPDRQQFTRLPDVPAMNHTIGLKEHAPVTSQYGYSEGFEDYSETPKQEEIRKNANPPKKANTAPVGSPKFDKDPLAKYVLEESRAKVMTVPTVTEELSGNFKKFFGADPNEDEFADYMPEQDNYRLQPDFHNAFEHAGVARAGSADAARLPNPSVNMFWKPLTQTGAQTSFMEHLPPPGGKYYNPPASKNGEVSMEEVMKKMDKIFARLDDMNVSSPEQITSELMMFVSSGIFVLFMMNLLVKKGSTMRF